MLSNHTTWSTSNSQADVLRLRLGSGDKVPVSLERIWAGVWCRCPQYPCQAGLGWAEVQPATPIRPRAYA